MKKRVMSFLLVLAICGLGIFSLALVQASGKVTITYWHPWGGYWGEKHNAITEIFNKTNPDIKVQTLTVPQAEIQAKLLTAIAGGNPPDLIHRWGSGDRGFFSKMFICLDSFMEESKDEMGPENWFPGTLDYVSFEGKVYGFLWVSVSEGLFYNIDMFEEAGLDPENPPKYWRDLEIAAEKLTKKDSRGRYETLGFQFPGVLESSASGIADWDVYWAYRNNGRWWDPDTRKMTCTDPKNIEAWEWLASWPKKYGVEETREFIASLRAIVQEPDGWFSRGSVAMREGGTWGIDYAVGHNPELNFDVTVIPYPEGGRPVHTNYGDSEHIPQGAKNVEEAWRFLFWHITEGQWRWTTTLGLTPSRPDLYNWGGFENVPRPDLFNKMVGYQQYGEASLSGFPLRGLFGEETKKYFDLVTSLKMTPQKALEELQGVMQKELDKFYQK